MKAKVSVCPAPSAIPQRIVELWPRVIPWCPEMGLKPDIHPKFLDFAKITGLPISYLPCRLSMPFGCPPHAFPALCFLISMRKAGKLGGKPAAWLLGLLLGYVDDWNRSDLNKCHCWGILAQTPLPSAI